MSKIVTGLLGTVSGLVPNVLKILADPRGLVLKTLPELIKLAAGGDFKGQAAEILRKKADEQKARTSAAALSGALCEVFDSVLDAPDSGLTLEQRLSVATGLRINLTLQAAEWLALYEEYVKAQLAVAHAKETKAPAATLAEARKYRTALRKALEDNGRDMARVVIGDDPRGTVPTPPATGTPPAAPAAPASGGANA
jgi:hypothetical protein